MDLNLLLQIQKSLEQKRQSVSTWLETATRDDLQALTGQAEPTAVQQELDILDQTLEKAQRGALDTCQVCHGEIEPALLELDYTACICLEDVSQEERRRLEAELEFSQTIQRALLPQKPPAPQTIDIAAFSRPADFISGDSYDFFKFRNGLDGIMIADAVGHGISAGLLMSSLQAAIRLLAPENDGPAPVLKRINRLFLHNYKFTTFATVFLASFDAATGNLTYSSAGHNPALLYCPSDGALTLLPPTGPAVGLVEVFKSATEIVRLKPGDTLLLYTDGVTEAHNLQREEFGLDRLTEIVQQQANDSAEELLHAVRLELGRFLNGVPLEDDVTLVAFKVNQN